MKKFLYFFTAVRNPQSQKGFTLIELIVVLAIFSIILGIITINLFRTHEQTTLGTTVELLITDLKQQQIKSMSGDTDITTIAKPHGIYFTSTSYTLFTGDTYTANNPTNTVIELPPTVTITTLPSTNPIIFAHASGTLTSATSFVIGGSSDQQTVHLNTLGVIYSVD